MIFSWIKKLDLMNINYYRVELSVKIFQYFGSLIDL